MDQVERNKIIAFILSDGLSVQRLLEMDEESFAAAVSAAPARKDELSALSNDELTEMKRQIHERQATLLAASTAAIEQSYFFNRPEASADHDYWSKMDLWTFEEAIALLLDRSPAAVSWSRVMPYAKVSEFAKRYERLRMLGLRSNTMNFGETSVHPLVALRWASFIEEPIPPALWDAVAARQALPPSTNSPSATPTSDGAPSTPTKEQPTERQERRLREFRQAGGAARRAGDSWQLGAGVHGALAALVRSESASGRPMSDKTNIRADLMAALDREAKG